MATLDSPRFGFKFFLDDGEALDMRDLVPVFHRWIQRRALGDLLIDVTDYSHVHDGPGTLLVAHEANYYLDQHAGKPGLLYVRKRASGDAVFRLRESLRAALQACRLLEEEEGLSLKFRTDSFSFRINDRRLAPNTDDTYLGVHDELKSFFSDVLEDDDVTLEHASEDARSLFEVRVNTSKAWEVGSLLSRLGPGSLRAL